MEVTKIDFTDDNAAKDNVVLYKNMLGKSKGKYLARFVRRTIDFLPRIPDRNVWDASLSDFLELQDGHARTKFHRRSSLTKLRGIK